MVRQTHRSRLNVRTVAGSKTVAGKTAALLDFPKFLAYLENVEAGATVILDFSEIDVATASYIDGIVFELIEQSRNGRLNYYFAVDGLSKAIEDEFQLVSNIRGPILQIRSSKNNRQLSTIGPLEASYERTLTQVASLGTTTAKKLQLAARQEQIGLTGWINRLTRLAEMRLIRKEKVGREFVYQAI